MPNIARLTVRLPADLYNWLYVLANDEQRTLSDMARLLLSAQRQAGRENTVLNARKVKNQGRIS